MSVKPIPEGYHTVTSYLIVNGAAAALDFYKKAFNATELFRIDGPGGKLGHAEFKIGDSILMIADEHPEMGIKGPKSYGGTPVSTLLYVEDCEAISAQAIAAGAKVLKPMADQFYGDRSCMIEDPFGHTWSIATHKEDVPADEMARRAAKLYGG